MVHVYLFRRVRLRVPGYVWGILNVRYGYRLGAQFKSRLVSVMFQSIWHLGCRLVDRGNVERFLPGSGVHPASYSLDTVGGGGCGFMGIKRLRCESDRSQPSSTEVKKSWRFAFTLSHAYMAWCFIKHQG